MDVYYWWILLFKQIDKDIRVKFQTPPSAQLNFRGVEKELRLVGGYQYGGIKVNSIFKNEGLVSWNDLIGLF